jgi:hypothetical protein
MRLLLIQEISAFAGMTNHKKTGLAMAESGLLIFFMILLMFSSG